MAAPFLFVIARWDLERYEFVRRHFAADPEVEVLFDRRVVDRRTGRGSAGRERRHADRRQRDVRPDLSALGWAYVRRAEAERAPGLLRAG